MNPRKRKKRGSLIQIGTGPAAVKIYTMTRADGYSEHTLTWKEGGRRRRRSISCPDEAQVVAQQITVRLTNGIATGDEVTRRDIELLRYCEQLAARFDLSLTVAMGEWVHARKLAGEIPLCEAVKWSVRCPWAEHHSGTADLSADCGTIVFNPPERLPAFKCLHAHCAERNFKSLVEWLEEKKPGLVASHCGQMRQWEAGQENMDGRPRILLPGRRPEPPQQL